MKYVFKRGDYFVTRDNKEGYILDLDVFGQNQTGFLLGYIGDKKQFLEYTTNGVYENDDFYLFEDYFKRIGIYDFTLNNKLPNVVFVDVGDEKLIINNKEVCVHKCLYPSDVLQALADYGIINYEWREGE